MVLRATDMSHGYQQSKEERYTAELVNQSGETLQNFAVDVKRSRNGKRVELSIRELSAALLSAQRKRQRSAAAAAEPAR